jgi:hypothetical protein
LAQTVCERLKAQIAAGSSQIAPKLIPNWSQTHTELTPNLLMCGALPPTLKNQAWFGGQH